jgi:hypothetical protein
VTSRYWPSPPKSAEAVEGGREPEAERREEDGEQMMVDDHNEDEKNGEPKLEKAKDPPDEPNKNGVVSQP